MGPPVATSPITTGPGGQATINEILPTVAPVGQFVFAKLVSTPNDISPASAPVKVQALSDLVISLSGSARQDFSYHHVQLTVTISNTGPLPAQNVVVIVSSSVGQLIPSSNFPDGTVQSLSPLTITIPGLPVGRSESLIADLTTRSAGPIDFHAAITSDSALPDPPHNVANLSVPLPIVTPAILESAIEGATGTTVKGLLTGLPSTRYRVDFYTIKNPASGGNGPVLPVASSTDVTTDASGNAVFVANVPLSDLAAPYVTSSVTGPGGTSDFSNAIPVTIASDLAVTLSSVPAAVQVGQALAVIAAVTNLGPSTPQVIVLKLELPANVTYGVDPFGPGTSVSFGADSVLVTLPGIAAGQSETFGLIVNPAYTGSLNVAASVASALADPDPSNNRATVATTIIPASPGPVIVKLQRIGVHEQPTRVKLRFNEALDATTAQYLSNYSVIDAGKNGRFGTRDDKVVELRSAKYNALESAVTLLFKNRINLHHTYAVVASGNGALGIRDLSGKPLNSRPDGTLGVPYRAVVRGFWLSAR